jgi:ParB family chromosome partitioning protein
MTKPDRKRGLGRGLSALMSDVHVEASGAEKEKTDALPQVLPIEMIQPNPDQPRKTFSQEELSELSASIREKGIIQPLVVRPISGGQYQIVAGERRWRAAQLANLHEVPVVVRDFNDVEVIEIAIIENVQRANLNPIEEASGYRQLMESFGHTQEQLATALGKSRSHIANLLRLLNLPTAVVQMVQTGDLSAGHARALITAEDPESIARKIAKDGLSVRAVEALVKKQGKGPSVGGGPRTGKQDAEKDADTRALEGDLSAALGMRVTVDHAPGNEGGTLSIRYQTLEQLDELCRALGGG